MALLTDDLHDELPRPGAGIEVDEHDMLPRAQGEFPFHEKQRNAIALPRRNVPFMKEIFERVVYVSIW